ncbi:hypothetical protein LTR53_009848 [Teratosphaeriaceae sp. CCFEE 6253]|nr:hypothetical protein LTR53_009848 [Teratosphaeriaceae sp. CCFEE 6253]
MVIPAFGFSFGDFAAAIAFVLKAAKALRETTGAPKQYQEAVIQLELLQDSLRIVQGLQPTVDNAATIHKVQVCAGACHLPLSEFMSSVKKYEQHFGLTPPTVSTIACHVVRGSRKIKWALAVEKQLAKLMASIAPYLHMINILLGTEAFHQAQRSQDFAQQGVQIGMDTLSQLRSIGHVVNTTVATQGQVAALLPAFGSALEQQLHVTRLDFNAVGAAVQQRLQEQQAVVQAALDRLPQASNVAPPSVPLHSSDTGETVTNVRRDDEAVARRAKELLDVFRQDFICFLLVLLDLISVIPRIMCTLSSLPRSPMLLLEEHIRLEDALGRVLSLPYEHFRFWPVLHARLQAEFRDRPGETMVARNEFHIINLAAKGDRVLTREVWDRSVVPGAQLAMSMLFRDRQTARQSCPGCESVGNAISHGSTQCRLTYRLFGSQSGKPTAVPSLQRAVRALATAVSFDDLVDDPDDSRDYSLPDDQDGCHASPTQDITHFRRVHLLRMPEQSVLPRRPLPVIRSRVYSHRRLKRVFLAAIRRAHEVQKHELASAVGEIWYLSLHNDRLLDLLDAILTQRATEEQTHEFQQYVKGAKRRVRDHRSEYDRVREECRRPGEARDEVPVPLRDTWSVHVHESGGDSDGGSDRDSGDTTSAYDFDSDEEDDDEYDERGHRYQEGYVEEDELTDDEEYDADDDREDNDDARGLRGKDGVPGAEGSSGASAMGRDQG